MKQITADEARNLVSMANGNEVSAKVKALNLIAGLIKVKAAEGYAELLVVPGDFLVLEDVDSQAIKDAMQELRTWGFAVNVPPIRGGYWVSWPDYVGEWWDSAL